MVRLKAAVLIAVAALSAPPTTTAQPTEEEVRSFERSVGALLEAARSRGSNGPLPPFFPSERFELFNDCEPVTVRVGVPFDIALYTNAGVETDIVRNRSTAAWIQSMAAFRLLNAGVLGEEAQERGRFRIRMTGSPDDFYARVVFQKVVIDLAAGEAAFATTWAVSGFGGRGRIDATPEAKASSLIDRFVTDYIAANADACAERGGR